MSTYVTVAIPYVNADPHLGYAYELVEADIYARARRRAGDEVRFLGGTDDYSLKNVLAAQAAGVPTTAYVDAHAERFRALAEPLAISFDDFIRTSTDPRHRPAVERLWRACAARGDLYQRSYTGEYCVGCEQFYAPADLVVDGDGRRSCREHLTPVEQVAETNWFFRLSTYQEHVERLIVSGQLDIHPAPFRDEVLAFVRGGLEDISVSRSARRARGWGIPVPVAGDGPPDRDDRDDDDDDNDDDQVIYVWFDALANYVSALEFGDPDSVAYRRWWLEADRRVHVIGKGILRFHAVYWPAFLASAGQPAPTRIEVHPYLTVDGAKISKSAGAVVSPETIVARSGVDPVRWWFARDVSATTDTDFTVARLIARANDDLANGIGNVTNRIVSLIHRVRGGRVTDPGARPIDALVDLEGDVLEALGGFDLRGAAQRVRDAVDALNRELEETKPWALASSPDVTHVDRLLSRHLASVRAIARAVEPIVPGLAARLIIQLDPGDDGVLPPPTPAFDRLE